MRSLKFVFIFLLIATCSYGQENLAEYEFFGFSADGKYMAFETHLAAPEGMSPNSKIVFVEVATNNYATKTLSLNGKADEDVAPVVAANKKKAQPLFAKYGITPGKNLGKGLPLVTEKDEYQRNVARPEQTFTINNVKYTLQLNEIEVGEMSDLYMRKKVMFELLLKYNGKTQILQKDKSIPASRGFTTGYSILSVWYFGDKLAVFLEYNNPGFEGYPDRYQMVVTGVLGK